MVEFHVADALALPFPDFRFDACRADRSLMHVPDPSKAVAEMVRVARPGGRVAVYEVDFETLTLDTNHRDVMRKVANAWCDSFRDGWLGRRMLGLFAQAGLKEISVSAHTMMLTPALARLLLGAATVDKSVEQGLLTEAEGKTWLRHLDELEKSGRFFCTLTGYLVSGVKQQGQP